MGEDNFRNYNSKENMADRVREHMGRQQLCVNVMHGSSPMLCLLALIWRIIRSVGRSLFRAAIYDTLSSEKQEMAAYTT